MSRSILMGLVLAGTLAACGGSAPTAPSVALTDLLGGGESDGFARAIEPRTFRFPADHGPHPEFRTEWWYVTGNLEADDGRPFGFHFTLFRRGLRQLGERSSDLAPDDLWMAHFAIADGTTGQVHAHERTARGAGGLAGATLGDDGLRVWLENWELTGLDGLGEGERPRLRLAAREGDDALALDLGALRPPVLQGDDGLSIKGEGDGLASYYYAVTRFDAEGALTVDGRRLEVSGQAWLDREWSTSVLGPNQVGWDWFALQLDDGSDVMLYQMRLDDGAVDATSHGSFTSADGAHAKLEGNQYAIRPTGTWRSPRTGGVYPSGWTITVPGRGLELEVTPLIEDQELPFAVVYWEGAVRVRGTRDGRPLEGLGFVELTGYADRSTPGR